MISKNNVYIILLLILYSCETNYLIFENEKVNIKANSEYRDSKKTFSGTLDESEFQELKENLEKEFGAEIPEGKSIFLNFFQRAPNCLSAGLDEDDSEIMAQNIVWNSSRIRNNYNIIDFFIYTQDSYNRDIYNKKTEFQLDPGYFYDSVFTEHENCSGFIIVKPNREFFKYYGEDYFTAANEFFENSQN